MNLEERLEKVCKRLRENKRLTQEELRTIGEELQALEELMRQKVH